MNSINYEAVKIEKPVNTKHILISTDTACFEALFLLWLQVSSDINPCL